MRKAEFWISTLIDKIVEAKNAKVDAVVIQDAQTQHLKAHILWEFWTAENSDGFHNPDLARESPNPFYMTRPRKELRSLIKLWGNSKTVRWFGEKNKGRRTTVPHKAGLGR